METLLFSFSKICLILATINSAFPWNPRLASCKFGRLVGGFHGDNSCICLPRGIYYISQSGCQATKEEKTKILATQEPHCYTIKNGVRERQVFLSDNVDDKALLGYGRDGGVVPEGRWEEAVGVVFIGASTVKITQDGGTVLCAQGKADSVCQVKFGNHGVRSVSMETCRVNYEKVVCREIIQNGGAEKGCGKRRSKRQDPEAPVSVTEPAPVASPAPETAPAPAPVASPAPEASPAPAPSPPPAKPPAQNGEYDPELDEDAALLSSAEVGHPIMRSQIARYLLATTAKMIGFHSDDDKVSSFIKRYPVLKLLELAKVVMEKTCPAISPNFFTMATHSFINLQMETFHLQEPYLSYPAFVRIETALRRCINDAKPHNFVGNYPTVPVATNNGTEYCDELPNFTSNKTTVIDPTSHEETMHNLEIPDYVSCCRHGNASSSLHVNEPLIETAWKVVVNAHSYCYTRFSEYYNDHHTFTVSMAPLFSNDVQDVWFGPEGQGYEISPDNKNALLYGGLLGNVGALLRDIDNCVAASRVTEGTAFPWFLNRPAKEVKIGQNKKRRKRSFNNHGDDHFYCLEKRHDFEAAVGGGGDGCYGDDG